jgi:3-oxoadipate enol-lactonase
MPRVRASSWPPEPPSTLPPARTLAAPGRGELFLRDTGGDGPAVMLLHGWIASADLNWWAAFDDLSEAGYRVLAIDHRGHGRGMRPAVPFRLVDCAADAAAALRELGVGAATVVGYSMGGAIAQLVARDHSDVVSGLVLSGTAQHWQDPESRRYWRTMGVFGLMLALTPMQTWRLGLRRAGVRESRETAWLLSELTRGSARDLAEAGRELGRFDSRQWLRPLQIPTAVVLTSRDEAVSPRKQRELADALDAEVFEAPIRHIQITSRAEKYNPALLEAIAAVQPAEQRESRLSARGVR